MALDQHRGWARKQESPKSCSFPRYVEEESVDAIAECVFLKKTAQITDHRDVYCDIWIRRRNLHTQPRMQNQSMSHQRNDSGISSRADNKSIHMNVAKCNVSECSISLFLQFVSKTTIVHSPNLMLKIQAVTIKFDFELPKHWKFGN